MNRDICTFFNVWQTPALLCYLLVSGLVALAGGCGYEGSSDMETTPEAALNSNGVHVRERAGTDLNPDPAHFARVSLDYEGVYEGVVPAASGPGILTRLILWPGERFELLRRHLDRETEGRRFSGSFSWLEDGGTIRLEGLEEESGPNHFFVAENRLFQLDMQGHRIEGPLAGEYVLEKQPPLMMPWPLFEHRWELREKEGEPLELDDLHRGWPFLEFDLLPARVGGMAGCNFFGGEFTLEEGKELHFSRLFSTMMACESLDTEHYFLSRIEETASWYLEAAGPDDADTSKHKRLCFADRDGDPVFCLDRRSHPPE